MKIKSHSHSLSSCFLIVCFLTAVFSAKILFLFPGGNISQKINIWPFVINLASRGHQITFYTYHEKVLQPHSNVTEVVASERLANAAGAVYSSNIFQEREDAGDDYEMVGAYFDISFEVCRLMLDKKSDLKLDNLIERGLNGEFDLVFVNSVLGECGTLIATSFGTKFIILSSTSILPWFHSVYDIPWEASTIPDWSIQLRHPLGFLQRFRNLRSYYKYSSRPDSYMESMENLMKERFGRTSVPSFTEMERNTSLLFVNIHHTIDFGRSLPPMVISIGGMQCLGAVGKLPTDIRVFMDNAENGVILISFGSTVDLSAISSHLLDIFFNMMKKNSNVRFICRWKGELPKNQPSNLLLAEWLPQTDILGHPNVRAFMTHCGMNSVTEATCFGVPLIAVPLFGDQDYSAYRIEAQEIGVKLEIRGLTQNIMDAAIEQILSDSKFKTNMMSRSKILKDKPQNPLETAVYWTEFVLRHDDMSAFKPMLLDQSTLVRHLADTFLVSLLLIIALPLVVLWFIVVLFRRCSKLKN